MNEQNEPLLTAMQLAIAGDWHAAHEIVQERNDLLACRIHGYLHRVEGDTGNAAYWYRQAGCPFPYCSQTDEAEQIIEYLRATDEA